MTPVHAEQFDLLLFRDAVTGAAYVAGDRAKFSALMREYEHAGRYFMTKSPLAMLVQIVAPWKAA